MLLRFSKRLHLLNKTILANKNIQFFSKPAPKQPGTLQEERNSQKPKREEIAQKGGGGVKHRTEGSQKGSKEYDYEGSVSESLSSLKHLLDINAKDFSKVKEYTMENTQSKSRIISQYDLRHSELIKKSATPALSENLKEKRASLLQRLKPIQKRYDSYITNSSNQDIQFFNQYLDQKKQKELENNYQLEEYHRGEQGIDYINLPPQVNEEIEKHISMNKMQIVKTIQAFLGLNHRLNRVDKVEMWKKIQQVKHWKPTNQQLIDMSRPYPGSKKGPNPQDDPEFYAKYLSKIIPLPLKQLIEDLARIKELGKSLNSISDLRPSRISEIADFEKEKDDRQEDDDEEEYFENKEQTVKEGDTAMAYEDSLQYFAEDASVGELNEDLAEATGNYTPVRDSEEFLQELPNKNLEIGGQKYRETNDITSYLQFPDISKLPFTQSYFFGNTHYEMTSGNNEDEIQPVPDNPEFSHEKFMPQLERWSVFRVFPKIRNFHKGLSLLIEQLQNGSLISNQPQMGSLFSYYYTLPKEARDHPHVKMVTQTLEFFRHDLTLQEKERMLNFAAQIILPPDEILVDISKDLFTQKYHMTAEDIEKLLDYERVELTQKIFDGIQSQTSSLDVLKEFPQPPSLDPLATHQPVENLPIDFYDNEDGFWDDYIKEKQRTYAEIPVSITRLNFQH